MTCLGMLSRLPLQDQSTLISWINDSWTRLYIGLSHPLMSSLLKPMVRLSLSCICTWLWHMVPQRTGQSLVSPQRSQTHPSNTDPLSIIQLARLFLLARVSGLQQPIQHVSLLPSSSRRTGYQSRRCRNHPVSQPRVATQGISTYRIKGERPFRRMLQKRLTTGHLFLKRCYTVTQAVLIMLL